MLIAKETALSIVQEMKAAAGCDINLMDDTGRILASTDPARMGQVHAGAKALLEQGLDRLVVHEDAPQQGTRRGINLPIRMDGRAVGVIGITGAPEQVEALGGVIQHMTEILLRDARRQEQETLLEDARQCFIESWLFSQESDLSELELRGQLLGIDITRLWTAALLEVRGQGESGAGRELCNARALTKIRPILRQEDALCAVVNQRILMLFESRGRHAALLRVDRIRSEMESACAVKVCGGVSAGGRQGLEVRLCYQEARTACLAARSGGGILFYDQASLEFLARSIPPAIRRDVYERVLGSCPAQERRELLEIIRLYFQYDGQTERMAAALYLHKNTVHYRLQKLKEKTGYSIRVPREGVLLCLCELFARQEEQS